MFDVIFAVIGALTTSLRDHQHLVFENLALRHQVRVLKRRERRPDLRTRDRLLWVGLKRVWPNWRAALLISQTWRSFLNNHPPEIAAMDFFVVPTATFRVFYVLLVLAHERRKVVSFNVTESRTTAWAAQPIVNAWEGC